MKQIMYKATVYLNRITEVEIIRQTAKFVVMEDADYRGLKKEIMEKKLSYECAYFETFIEAKNWLIEEHIKKHASAKRALDYARSKLEEAKRIKE